MRALLLPALLLSACATPTADPEFSEAARYLFRHFEDGQAELAFATRALQDQLRDQLDLQASATDERTLTPEPIQPEDLQDVQTPEGDPTLGLATTVARLSPHPVAAFVDIQLLHDHTPVEPNSPNQYQRTFLEGTEACFPDRSCEALRTDNDVVKENPLLSIPYGMRKDFRWVDVALPDPSSDEPAGEPSWGLLSRSWVPVRSVGDSGVNVLNHQYAVEAYVPVDGGTLRTMSLWFHIEGEVGDEDFQELTARNGIDAIFRAGDDWLDDR
jgi:hypothetical protein